MSINGCGTVDGSGGVAVDQVVVLCETPPEGKGTEGLITTLIPTPTPRLTDMELLKDDTPALYEMEVEVKLSHRSSRRGLR
jgi:hypothetical protein